MGLYTKKTEITREEYLKLLGLLELAKRHNRTLEEIRDAACAIVGETPDEGGLIADEVWSTDPNLDSALKLSEIKVLE